MANTFKIVRFYQKGRKRVLKSGVTLLDAQAHCNDPETDFLTCTKSIGRKRTQRMGPWFDGYMHE